MNPHDIAAVEPESDLVWAVCACGRRFPGTTAEKAKERHRSHHGVEMARQALRGEESEG